MTITEGVKYALIITGARHAEDGSPSIRSAPGGRAIKQTSNVEQSGVGVSAIVGRASKAVQNAFLSSRRHFVNSAAVKS